MQSLTTKKKTTADGINDVGNNSFMEAIEGAKLS